MNQDRSAPIREQMSQIRSALRDDAATIVENAKLSMDWRHYVEKYPWACMAGAAILGFLIVPKRRPTGVIDPNVVKEIARRLEAEANSKGAKPRAPGMIATLAGIAIPMLTRAAVQGGLSVVQNRFRTSLTESERRLGEDVFQRSARPR